MLDDLAGAYGSRFLLAAGGVGIALLVLIGVLWLLRNRAPSPFVRGGKNRQPRLQVLDAAAVDARRRLVLVRRDGVEHLIMIGGPTDIVIESGIFDTRTVPAPAASFETLSAEEPAPPVAQPIPAREPPRIVARQPAPVEQKPEPPQEDPYVAPAAAPEPEPVATAAPVSGVASFEPRQRQEPAFVPEPANRPQEVLRRQPPAMETEPQIATLPPRSERTSSPPERTEETEAADILDAARHRVLQPEDRRQQRIEPQVERFPVDRPVESVPAATERPFVAPRDNDIRPMPAVATPAAVAMMNATPAVAPQPRELGTDFQSVLEAEMSHNLTAERIVASGPAQSPQRAPQPQPQPQPIPGQQRRDPELAPPVAGADAALQKEVARIFGEMSVNRDK